MVRLGLFLYDHIGGLGHAGAADEAIARHRHGRAGRVAHALPDGDHVTVVHRQLDAEGEGTALSARPARTVRRQRHRVPGREDRRGGFPHSVRVRRLQPVAVPAELREVRLRRTGRGQQPDRGRALRDRFLILDQHQIVDPRSLEVDRSGELGGDDPHPRRLAQHGRAVTGRDRVVGGRLGGRVGERLRLAVDDPGRGRVRGREEPRLHERPAEQDQRREHREHQEIAGVILHGHLPCIGTRRRARDGQGTGSWP